MTDPQALRTDDQRQLAKLIGKQRVAMLAMTAANGLLEAKPMTLLEHDAHGHLWFFCEAELQDAVMRERYKTANLSFSDEPHATYVSISGRGELLHDRERIHALWSPMAKPWFPDGPDSPRLALLKFIPSQAETWDGPGSSVLRMLALAASVVSGKPVGMGEHAVLTQVHTPHSTPESTA